MPFHVFAARLLCPRLFAMTPTEKLLRELIALPSVNPAFMPAGDPRAGEGRVADFLLATAASAGLDVELRPVFPGRPNLLARLTPPEKFAAGCCSRRTWTPWAMWRCPMHFSNRAPKTDGFMVAARVTPKVPWPRC